MRRWLLVVVVLLAGVGVAIHALASSPAHPQHSVALSDTLSLDIAPGAAIAQPVSLGMGAGTSDLLLAAPSISGALRDVGVQVLRFGDVHADDYDWRNGCIYADVGARHDCYGAAGHDSLFDRFLAFSAQVGAQPFIVVNGEVDDPQQAAELVAYYWQHCSGSPNCPDPYWEIGDSPAQWRHFAVPLARRQTSDAFGILPDQYAALVVAYSAAMAQATPYYQHHAIKIVADEWITGASDQSWVDAVASGGVDTHYAPIQYSGSGPSPTVQDVVDAVQLGYEGHPGLDSWLQDRRDSLAQFNQPIQLILGQWSIDANPSALSVYSGYAQALFAAEIFAHVWQDAEPNSPSPLVLAVQAPMIGEAQEPFDVETSSPRAAVSVYALVDRYFGSHPVQVQESGGALVQEGSGAPAPVVAAAGSLVSVKDARLLLVNTDGTKAQTVDLQGVPAGKRDVWWIVPDPQAGAAGQPSGASAIRHQIVTGNRITLQPWAIAVVRVQLQ